MSVAGCGRVSEGVLRVLEKTNLEGSVSREQVLGVGAQRVVTSLPGWQPL